MDGSRGAVPAEFSKVTEQARTWSSGVLDASKAQLASMPGTPPEALSRIFADMTAKGFIRVGRRDVALPDSEGLYGV